jgi:subtilisin family serine protease
VKNIGIAFVDGVAETSHANLRGARIEVLGQARTSGWAAREHATFIASVFAGSGPACLGLTPECPLLNIGVVDDVMLAGSARPRENGTRLAAAISLASAHGASIIQVSLDLSLQVAEARPLIAAVGVAVARGAVVVVAAGQRPFAADNTLLSAPGVLSVSGADPRGYPLHSLHRSAALNACGLSAPALDIPGAVLPAGTGLRSGTSFAACFVTAALALLCSAVPCMTPRDAALRLSAGRLAARRRALPVPLDADGCIERF